MDVWLHFIILSNLMLDQGHAKRMFEGEIAGKKHRSIISSLSTRDWAHCHLILSVPPALSPSLYLTFLGGTAHV